MGKAIMVLGTTSGAGKSFLATALCRYFANNGLRVAPFKAQNMSNNARVADGGEIGSAQYFQALAAKVTPDVRMNPVLLKPEADSASQVVLMGKVSRELVQCIGMRVRRKCGPSFATRFTHSWKSTIYSSSKAQAVPRRSILCVRIS